VPNPLLKKTEREERRLTWRAAAEGEVEGDSRALLTKDDLPRCSQWREVCWLKDDCLNGGPSVLL